MANNTTTILSPAADKSFTLANVARDQLDRIDIVDVDLVLTTKDGARFVLPNVGLDSMSGHPPQIIFADGAMSAADLLGKVGVTVDVALDNLIPTSQEIQDKKLSLDQKKDQEKLAKEAEELKKQVEKLHQEMDAQKKQHDEDYKKMQEQQQEHSKKTDPSNTLTANTEAAVEQMVKEAAKIEETIHSKDYDYTPPRAFNPPPSPITAADGVPPPLNMTPFVSITIGNVPGTTTSGSYIYGGGGAVGTGADAFLGPRDPLQFSPATIAGTAAADIIYAGGPLVGNATPITDRSNNAKEIILNVAGYFTSLQDVTISGVPSGVSIVGATDRGGGVWVLPASYATDTLPFTLVYNMDSWRSGANTFDLSINVAGEGAKGQFFDTTQTFRFMYMDVTDVSQVTNPALVYDSRGVAKQIYVLPTLGAPTIINSGNGDDQVYGWVGADTITTGNGNNTIHAGAGDDIVVTGTGNNTIDLGSGNNQSTSLSGNDVITAGDGNNTIQAGDGNNTITVGNGVNTIVGGAGIDTITTGTGNATIDAGDGNNVISTHGGIVNITAGANDDSISAVGGSGVIHAGNGTNTISVTTGNFVITAGSGDDSVTAGGGNNTIDVGAGNNTVVVGDGNNILTGGAGNDHFTAGNGDNVFRSGLGTNVITAGTGNNTIDYSLVTTTAVAISLATGTATGTGLSDSFTGVENVIGSSQNDTITGNSQINILNGGAGDDTIVGGGGNDTFYGGDGNDTITGGTGNDIIYAGNGDNTVYTGTSGADFVYGGTGNNTFISQHAGVTYNGTNGANFVAGVYNTVNYAADTAGLTINLLAGFGIGGMANGDIYVATPTSGVNSINKIIAGSGSDSLTDSNGNDYIDGGSGSNVYNIYNGNDIAVGGASTDQFISYGTGNKTYTGNGGTNYYDMGVATEQIVTGTGTDVLRYHRSLAGVIVNLDTVAHVAVNSVGGSVNVGAASAAGWGAVAADANSYAIGDTFTGNSMDYFLGSTGSDLVWGTSGAAMTFEGYGGIDWFFGGAGNDLLRLTDNDRLDGGTGTSDTLYTAGNANGSVYTTNSVTVYLDGTVDLNANGIADYLDKGVSSLTFASGANPTGSSLAYAGFATGYSGTSYLKNIENIFSESGNDLLVGDSNNNILNGRGGNNTLYGMGGDDTLHTAAGGTNTLYGGSGIDTVDFSNTWNGIGTTTAAYVFLSDATFMGASDKLLYMGAANMAYQAKTDGGTLVYISEVENMTGSSLNDVLYGNASDNTITAGSGDDIIAGNGGVDLLYGNNGNDKFYITTSQLSSVSLLDGGSGTDTVVASGYAMTAGSIAGAKFTSIEALDIRNSAGGGSYSMNANDIVGLADNGISSSVTLKLDSGDTFTPTVGAGTGALSYLVASSTATNTVYYFYSDAGHAVANATNRVAILDVYTGTA